jgi:hypothetical protein
MLLRRLRKLARHDLPARDERCPGEAIAAAVSGGSHDQLPAPGAARL